MRQKKIYDRISFSFSQRIRFGMENNMNARIIGTGRCLPDNIVSNDDLSKIVETNDEWISSRTGIRNRHISTGENTSQISVEAAKLAMEDAGVTPEEIDLIIVATLSPDYFTPHVSCMVQSEIGAVNAFCFDLNAACSGFLFALNTVHAYIQSGMIRTALVIGAEVLSKIVDWTDRGTCVLFGDGAGAAVVQASESAGVQHTVVGSEGAKGMVLTCPGRNLTNMCLKDDTGMGYVAMDGQEVFKFAVKTVPKSITEVLEKANVSTDEVKYFILHQANERIISSVAKHLKVDTDKFPMNLQNTGNTSAASIPILLDEVNKKGMLQPGDKIVLAGFGGGLTWGCAYVEW